MAGANGLQQDGGRGPPEAFLERLAFVTGTDHLAGVDVHEPELTDGPRRDVADLPREAAGSSRWTVRFQDWMYPRSRFFGYPVQA